MKQDFNYKDSVSLREYFEKIIQHNEATYEKALIIARDELARRLEALNGEAGRLAKMQETYYPRQVAEPRLESIEKEITDLKISRAALDGKANQKDLDNSKILLYITLLISLTNLVLRLFGV